MKIAEGKLMNECDFTLFPYKGCCNIMSLNKQTIVATDIKLFCGILMLLWWQIFRSGKFHLQG